MTLTEIGKIASKAVIIVLSALVFSKAAGAEEAIDIGNRRELFLDYYLIEKMTGSAELRLHKPVEREVALTADQPWEGNVSAYLTVFKDGDIFRMYYRAWHMNNFRMNPDAPRTFSNHGPFTCYAESADGIHWEKPKLGIVEFEGTTNNNIVWDGEASGSFAPFKDDNPNAPADARYKAVAHEQRNGTGVLMAFKSPDGFHWEYVQKEPIITGSPFDSLNTAFWDPVRKEYRAYWRHYASARWIMTATSDDFINWSEGKLIEFPDGEPMHNMHLYTNAIRPYYRAPHLFVGFPMRFIGYVNPTQHPKMHGISDALFISSRDGLHFHGWAEALIRPGLQESRWVSRNNIPAWGLIETESPLAGTPPEISMYTTEGYGGSDDVVKLRRHTFRLDGFVSLHAGMQPAREGAPYVLPNHPKGGGVAGGEVVTRPLIFGESLNNKPVGLFLNLSTSAAGSVRVELQDADGNAFPGFTLSDCEVIQTDAIDHLVNWKENRNLQNLAGKPVRLRFEIKDADIYAMQFLTFEPEEKE